MSRARSLAGGGFKVAVLAFTGTLLLAGTTGLQEIRTSVLGLGGDPYQTLWRFDALTDAVARCSLTVPRDPIRNLGPLPWLPLHILLGEPLAYNVIWLLQGPLTALATYALGRALGLTAFPAAVAGILAAFAPYRIAQSLGHFGAMQVFWIPAACAAMLAWLKSPKPATTVLLAALLVGTAWTEHTLFLTTLIAMIVGGLVFLQAVRAAFKRPKAILLAAMLLLLLAGAVLPFWSEIVSASRIASPLNPGEAQRLRFAPMLDSLFALAPFHPLRNVSQPWGTPTHTVADEVHFLGIAAVILAGIGAWRWREGNRRSAVFLAGLAFAGIGLAVSPRLPLLASLLEHLPVFSALRVVNRFLALPSFALPLLASAGLPRQPRGLQALLVGLLALEVLPLAPFPAQSAEIPGFYERLRAERPGKILEIPSATDYLVASQALYASTVHGREVVGSIAFERVEDPTERNALLNVPALRDVLLMRPTDLELPTFFGQRPHDLAHAALASEEIMAVVLHGPEGDHSVFRFGFPRPQPASDADVALVRSFLREVGFPEEQADPITFLYRIPPWPVTQSAAFAIRGPGWDEVQRNEDGAFRATLTKNSRFEVRVLGSSVNALAVAFRVADNSAKGNVRLMNAQGETETRAVQPGEEVLWSLQALPPGKHAYMFSIDESKIIVENLSFRRREKQQ